MKRNQDNNSAHLQDEIVMNINAQDVNRDDGGATISADVIRELVLSGELRYKDVGSSGFWGFGAPFFGDLERAADVLVWSLESDVSSVYEDDEGIFIGPSYSFLLTHCEIDPHAEGGMVQ